MAEAIGLVGDHYVQEAITYRRKKRTARWVALAACLCLAAALLVPWARTGPGGLPMLEVGDVTGGGMGFEGVLCYDISEVVNGNPWSGDETGPTALPVYRNGAYHPAGEPVGLTEEEMVERLEQAAGALDMELGEPEYERGGLLGAAVTRITAADGAVELAVEADGTVTVQFSEGMPLPEGYRLAYLDLARMPELPEEERFDGLGVDRQTAQATLDYLTERFGALLDFSSTRAVLGGDYIMWNDYDERGNYLSGPAYEWEYTAYDAGGDLVEDLLNYSFRQARFYPDEAGGLGLIRLYDGLCCGEKLGDYPIITAEQARELLLEGNYVTSVPYPMAGEEHIARVELVYRTGRVERTLMPYYRFYVGLPELEREDGLTDYGAYYVPAVEQKYIQDMPVYDGRFN